MAKVIDRAVEPISLEGGPKGSISLRIHGSGGGQGDRFTYLTPHEMRVLAYRLLAEAEALTSN